MRPLCIIYAIRKREGREKERHTFEVISRRDIDRERDEKGEGNGKKRAREGTTESKCVCERESGRE